MRIEKKWAVKNAPNKLSDNQMKHVVAGYGDGDGYGSSEGNCSLKCLNTTHSCWVVKCPTKRTDLAALCKQSKCGGAYNDYASCGCS